MCQTLPQVLAMQKQSFISTFTIKKRAQAGFESCWVKYAPPLWNLSDFSKLWEKNAQEWSCVQS